MSIHIPKFNITYYPVPKNACTSIKHSLYTIENGRQFENFFAGGKGKNIHSIYPSTRFPDPQATIQPKSIINSNKFAVYRDPIQRFLSAFSNRVINHRELNANRLAKNDKFSALQPDPEPGYLVEQLDNYLKVPTIAHHMSPQVNFLGNDPSFYTYLVDISELHKLEDFLSHIIGRDISFPRLQTGGPKLKTDILTKSQLSILRAFYKDDYTFISKI